MLNRAEFIAWSIESLKQQFASDIEHIIVDGGSTDGTLPRLAEFPHTRVINGPDEGLYDAINKGIARAQGSIIGLLNSDDAYLPGAISSLRQALEASPSAEMVVARASTADLDPDSTPDIIVNDEATKQLVPSCVLTGVPIINARFFHRRLLERVGAFDRRFPVAADRDFLIRCIAAKARIASVSECIYRYTMHPGSLTVFPHSRFAQNRHNLDAARARLAEGKASELGSLFAGWHAWTTGYQVGLLAQEGAVLSSLSAVARGLTEAPMWPLRFAPLLLSHWLRARRRERRE
ncbi:MAG: glycosyltransferase [Rhodospirillales bacterium]|nr:glycosyltransferase [Rhodospirillales bacterium]